MNSIFQNWLTSGDKGLLRLALGHETYFFLRAERRPGFEYLYCQRQFHENSLRRGDKFAYVGIYCAADGLVYDAEYTLTRLEGMDETLAARQQERLLDQLQRDVRKMVEQRVANDRRNLTVAELASPESVQALEQYRKYYAMREARELYLAGGEPGNEDFSCAYRVEPWTEDSLLDYITDPLTCAEREAERYWAEAQEDMLLQFLQADAMAAAYAELTETPETPVHTIRAIMAAMRESPAKTVTVTIRRDGEEFSFKTEAAELRRDCGEHYNSWNIAAADRRAFEKRYGRHADYTPQEIVRITYGRSTLYEAQR